MNMDTNLTVLNIITIITTSILAIAAILTYLVQRARYLREIEPDLELKWPEKFRDIRLGSTFNDWWSFYIDIEIENLSNNHAEDLEYEVKIGIFPHRGRPQYVGGKIGDLPGMHPLELLAKRKTTIPVYVGKNFATELKPAERLNGAVIAEAGFHATIIFSYYGRREFLLWFLIPWKGGRRKYIRKIFGSWFFEFNEETHTYNARWWEHPSVPQHVQQNVSNRKNGW